MISSSKKACPFVARECLREGCMAWAEEHCRLIPEVRRLSAFDLKLENSAPLMYRSLLDLVEVMEETSKECKRCGPELWNYAQEVRTGLLDALIKEELAGVGIKAEKNENWRRR
jgi:hypothetical protein